MNNAPPQSDTESTNWQSTGLLISLICLAILLLIRLGVIYFSDPSQFPIRIVKVEASYEHVTHQDIENILRPFLEDSFFSLSISSLQQALVNQDWIQSATISKVWPDAIHIVLKEQVPLGIYGQQLIASEGVLFGLASEYHEKWLPQMKGPLEGHKEVLQVYKKLSKILDGCELKISSLILNENQAWEMTLINGINLFIGKQAIEDRLQRFCKAYPGLMAEKTKPPVRVDLRYPQAMAIQWNH